MVGCGVRGLLRALAVVVACGALALPAAAADFGANDDGGFKNQLEPGETRTLATLEGPGVISHMWFTIATREVFHLKKIVLRMYWDGEESPSVEAPIGDFFGLGLGDYFLYESEVLSVGSQKALNSYFPMLS